MFYGYEKFYVNGTSYTQGGGLEEPEKVGDEASVYRFYKELYDTPKWNSRSEVNYGARLSEELGIPCVNEAQSGGSCERMVRMTYDFIKKNWNRKDKLFLVLELPSLGRLDLWSNLLNDYFIFNLEFKNQEYSDNSVLSLFGTKKYYSKDTQTDNTKLSFGLSQYHKLFFDKKDEYKKISREINTLLTYLKYHKIKFIFFDGEFGGSIDSDIKKSNMVDIKVGNMSINDFHEYAIRTKGTLAEETLKRYSCEETNRLTLKNDKIYTIE